MSRPLRGGRSRWPLKGLKLAQQPRKLYAPLVCRVLRRVVLTREEFRSVRARIRNSLEPHHLLLHRLKREPSSNSGNEHLPRLSCPRVARPLGQRVPQGDESVVGTCERRSSAREAKRIRLDALVPGCENVKP
jgi:hypothetical protein